MSDPALPEVPESEPAAPAAAVRESGLGTTASGAKNRLGKKPPLFVGGTAALVATLAYYSYASASDNPLLTACGLLMIFLAALPALRWSLRTDYRFPVFEVFMLTGINTYAIPLLSGHKQLALFEEDALFTAASGVILYQIVANLTYNLTRARPIRSRAWREEVVASNVADYLGYAMIITTIYTMITVLEPLLIPSGIDGVIRAGAYGVGIIATFIQSRMWGHGTLPHHRKATFLSLLVAQVIFSWAALFLIGGISILVLGLLGYVSTSKKIPVLALAIVLPVVGVLHSGKGRMREIYWEGGAPPPTLTEIPAFFIEWVGYGIDPDEIERRKEQNNRLLERTSLFHVLCLVTANTPSRLPFLGGETYTSIPGQFIPRYFWPSKPPSHIGTYKLSTYYGLQGEEDTRRTTIAFGLLSEAYANFGYFGMGLLGFTFAFFMKKMSEWAAESPILSYPGLFLVVLMAWSFQSELTLTAWISSFYQAVIAVLGVPFMVRNFIGR